MASSIVEQLQLESDSFSAVKLLSSLLFVGTVASLWHHLQGGSLPLESDAAIRSKARARSVAPTVPSWLPFLGSAPDFRRDPAAFLKACRGRFGSTFRLNLGGRSFTFLTDPRDFQGLIRSPDFSLDPINAELNRSAVGVDADVVKHIGAGSEIDATIHSQYIKYLASGEGLKELSDRTVKQVQKILRRDFSSQSGSPSPPPVHSVQLYDWVKRVMFEAGIVSLYGEEFYESERVLEEFKLYDKAFPALASNIPGSNWLFRRGIREGRDKLTSRLREAAGEGSALASTFIKARDELFASKRQVLTAATGRDNGPAVQLGVLWASQANAIPATFWTLFFLLADDKGAWEEVEAEVKEHLARRDTEEKTTKDSTVWEEDGGRQKMGDDTVKAATEPDDGGFYDWSTEQLARCVKLESAINETLRLTNGAMVMREAMRDTFLHLPSYADEDDVGEGDRGIHVKKGEHVALLVTLNHMDEKLFPEPETFKFDRFLQEKQRPHEALKLSFLPFGAGRSLCPGRHWAKNEIKAFIAALMLSLQQKPQLRSSETVEQLNDTTSNPMSAENLHLRGRHCWPAFDVERVGFGIFPPKTDVEVRLQFSA